MDKQKTCAVCSSECKPKGYRTLLKEQLAILTALAIFGKNETLKRQYVCSSCFNKLNCIQKVDNDIAVKVTQLKQEREQLCSCLLNLARSPIGTVSISGPSGSGAAKLSEQDIAHASGSSPVTCSIRASTVNVGVKRGLIKTPTPTKTFKKLFHGPSPRRTGQASGSVESRRPLLPRK